MVRDLAPVYDRARVVIAPGRFAVSAPLQICEAAARGVPVVATRALANQLGWRPDEDLLVSDPSDSLAFADSVMALYTEPARWARVRKRALARVRAEFPPGLSLRVLARVLEARSSQGALGALTVSLGEMKR
jgi:glycosyltransferase involved in cell wall biosynthesis